MRLDGTIILVALTLDTEYPTSWRRELGTAAQRALALLSLARELAVPLTWMLKISAQEKRANAEHFFEKIAPDLPAGHEVGLHVHFDDEEREHYIREPEDRAALIAEGAALLREFGVQPACFRAGCLRAEASDLQALEAEGIVVESSIAPGAAGSRHLADWTSASLHAPYHPARDDLTHSGDSPLVEVPLVTDGSKPLWLDTWQTTPESHAILEAALARGDRYLGVIGHDGTTDLERFRTVVARLTALEARFVTLHELALDWLAAENRTEDLGD